MLFLEYEKDNLKLLYNKIIIVVTIYYLSSNDNFKTLSNSSSSSFLNLLCELASISLKARASSKSLSIDCGYLNWVSLLMGTTLNTVHTFVVLSGDVSLIQH